MNAKQIQQLNNHVEFIFKKNSRYNKYFDRINKRLERLDSYFEKVFNSLLNLEDSLKWVDENMAVKEDFAKMTSTIDFAVKISREIKEDQVFVVARIKKIQDKITSHEKQIKLVKPLLK